MLLFTLEQAQQKWQPVLCPLQLVVRILSPDQTQRNHLGFAYLRDIHYWSTITKCFTLGHLRSDSVGVKINQNNFRRDWDTTHHSHRKTLPVCRPQNFVLPDGDSEGSLHRTAWTDQNLLKLAQNGVSSLHRLWQRIWNPRRPPDAGSYS